MSDVNNIIHCLDRARNDEANRLMYIGQARGYATTMQEYMTQLELTVATLSAELVNRTPKKP